MAKTKTTKRTRRTPEQRAKILAAAAKEGLTAKDVEKRFGVPVVTYYSWRKKSKAPKRRARPVVTRPSQNGGLQGRVRGAVETRMRDLLPQLVEAEINRYLDTVLGSGGRRKG